MAARDNLHSRIVAWLRIILPLSALVLLSSVFLVARQREPSGTIPFSENDLQEMASEKAVEDPVFASVTDEGQRVVITADEAIPRGGDYSVIDAVNMHGILEEKDGETIDVRSETGTIYSEESQTVLRGNVRIVTSSGYRLLTEELISAMDKTDMETTGPVSGDGPAGTIEAGRMRVTSQTSQDGTEESVRVVFNGGVKVIYLPQTK